MTGVSWRPPPPRTGWLGQRCAGRSLGGGGRPSVWGGAAERLGGEAAERMGGRRPVKVTDSRERWPGGPSSGGHRPGGKRRRANEDDRSCQDGVYGSCCSPLGLNY